MEIAGATESVLRHLFTSHKQTLTCSWGVLVSLAPAPRSGKAQWSLTVGIRKQVPSTHTHTLAMRGCSSESPGLSGRGDPATLCRFCTTSCVSSETLREPYLDLFVRGYSAENNLCEALGREHPEADTANDTAIFD